MPELLPHNLGPWTGGVNYAMPAEDLGPNEIFDARNCKVGAGGEVYQRDGFEPYPDNTSQISANDVTAIGQMRFSSSSIKTWAFAGTDFVENMSGTWTSRKPGSGVTINDGINNYWSMVNANGVLCGHSGVSGDTILRWNASGGNVAALDVDSRFTWSKWWEWWDGRLWAGNNSNSVDQIQRSSNTDITAWGNDYYLLGEENTGVKSFGNGALAMYGEDIIVLLSPTGNASIPYRRQGRSGRGTVSGRSIVSIPGPNNTVVHLFVRDDGIYAFAGDEARKISWKLDGIRYWDNVNVSALHNSFAVENRDLNEVWFFLPYATSTKMNHIVVYNYLRDQWYGPMVSEAGGNDWNCGATIDGLVHAGGYADVGKEYRMDVTDELNDDDGGGSEKEIVAYFTTGAPPPNGIDVRSRWWWARVAYDVKGDYSVQVTHFSPRIPSQTESIDQGGGYHAIETAFRVATSSIAGEDLMASEDTGLTGYDYTMQMKFANGSLNEEFSIRRAALMHEPLGRLRNDSAGVS